MIGTYLESTMRSTFYRLLHRYFGVPDFHAHVRSHWMDRYADVGQKSFCELGCGVGINLFELLLKAGQASGVGYEADGNEVARGTEVAGKLGLSRRLVLRQTDLNEDLPGEVGTADYILLIDVLEHLHDPQRAADNIVQAMKPDASLLVSVPTHLYPHIFGRKFHVGIGHLHPGFSLQELDQLCRGLSRVWHQYSTGPLTWPGVVFYYRWAHSIAGSSVPRIFATVSNALAILSSIPFRYLDYWNAPSVSCSLFVEYTKCERLELASQGQYAS